MLQCWIGWLLLVASHAVMATPLRIATSANARQAMETLATAYQQKQQQEVHIIVASSGKLLAQIRAGAPFDVFVSADEHYPRQLFQQGLGLSEPKIYAHGKLALWSPKKPLPENWRQWLPSADVYHLVIANPETAPYGEQAIAVLKSLHLYQALQSRLVYAESVGQIQQFLLTGAASVGITAWSALPANFREPGHAHVMLFDESLYQPIRQAAVLLKNTQQPEKAEQFYRYLFSAEAQTIFLQHGYTLP